MVIVLTCARPGGVDYLAATLRGVDASVTGHRKIVLVDGDSDPALPPGWELARYQKPPGATPTHNKHATWEAFRIAEHAGEDLAFFEDDVMFCKNGARFVADFRVPEDVALVSFFSPYFEHGSPAGLYRMPAGFAYFVYCQALKIPWRTLRALGVEHDRVEADAGAGGSDEQLRLLGVEKGWRWGLAVPSVVQHVGFQSAVGHQFGYCGGVSRTFDGLIDPGALTTLYV